MPLSTPPTPPPPSRRLPRVGRSLAPLLVVTLVVAGAARSVQAQAVDVINDEALTLPAGVTRWSISQNDIRYDLRYGTNGLQPLGADLTLDSLNVQQLPILGPLQTQLRSLSQDPTLGVTLGATTTESSVRVSITPIGLAVGLTHWLTLRATVPIVQTYNVVLFNPNSHALNGNVGLNPALAFAAALAIDTALYGQLTSASMALQTDLRMCQSNPSSEPYCGSLLSQQRAINSLISSSNSFASALSQVYGGGGRAPSPVVPVDSSSALNAINRRLQSFAAAYAHFDSLTMGPGISGPGPVGAPPIGLGDMTQLLTTNLIGLGFDTLQTVDRVGLGDIEVGATALLLDSFHGNDSLRLRPNGFNYRLAATLGFRLGTGQPNSPDGLTGVGTGTGENAVLLSANSDLLLGRHWWASVALRTTFPLADQITARIPLGLGEEFAPYFTRQMVGRTLGNTIDFEVDPRYTINQYFGALLQYRIMHTSMASYTGVFSIDSAVTGFGPVKLNASALDAGTETTSQRWGFGLEFSTVASTLRHPRRLAMDVSYMHYQLFSGWAGAGGILPHSGGDAVQIRIYVRAFGSGGYLHPGS